jgi:hypothetical protein
MTTLGVTASDVLDLEIMLAQNGFSAGQLSPGTVGVMLPNGGSLVAYGAFTEEGTTFYAVDIYNAASWESGEDDDALALPGYLTASQVVREVRSCCEGSSM